MRAVQTVSATVIGALLGGYVAGIAAGGLLSAVGSGGLEDLATALLAALGGAFVGATIGVLIVFRDAPVRERLITVATMLIIGPPLSIALASAAARAENSFLLLVAIIVGMAGTALLGRWLALRGSDRRSDSDADRSSADVAQP
jgi:preprotein translocase subunit SecF